MVSSSRQRPEVAPLSRKRASVVVEKFNGYTYGGWELGPRDRVWPLPARESLALLARSESLGCNIPRQNEEYPEVWCLGTEMSAKINFDGVLLRITKAQ